LDINQQQYEQTFRNWKLVFHHDFCLCAVCVCIVYLFTMTTTATTTITKATAKPTQTQAAKFIRVVVYIVVRSLPVPRKFFLFIVIFCTGSTLELLMLDERNEKGE
jgi:hypothetical protein